MVRPMISIEALVRAGLYPAPQWFPQSMDPNREWVRMVLFKDEDYRKAPFLDERGIRDGMPQGIVPWTLLAELTRQEHRSDAHWIFHISHVGSTLISRLIGEIDGTLCLREPLILRSLFKGSKEEAIQRIPIIRRLLSRCFNPSDRAIVKATSRVSELAAPLVGPAATGGNALFISINPRDFIVSRLSRDKDELAERAPERLSRLKQRLPGLDPTQATSSKARLAAMTWACEASSIENAMDRIDPERRMFLNFANFLQDPRSGLADLARHFGLSADQDRIDVIIGGPLMRRNSKDNAQVVMTAERKRAEDKTSVREKEAIDDALAWLDRQRGLSELIDRACARFELAT